MKKSFYLLCCILFLLSCNSDKEDWKKVVKENTIEAYQSYLEKHTDGEYIDSAKNYIEKLEYNSAINKKSIKHIEDFIKKYPKSIYLKNAKDYLEKLSVDKEILAYLGYIDIESKIKLINDHDLEGKYLTARVMMDIGTEFIDLYFEDKIAIYAEAGGKVMVLYIEDDVKIEYKSGNILTYKNNNENELVKNKDYVKNSLKSGLTFETDVDGVKASRTYVSGGMTIY